MPTAHYFDSTGEAYDASQCDDNIHNGDVLVVKNEHAVAILIEAWPAALEDKLKGENFHVWNPDFDIRHVEQYGSEALTYKDYSESVTLAKQEVEKLV